VARPRRVRLPGRRDGARRRRDARAYALLVGVDAGPNLLVTGSLATLLWLAVARERDASVSPGRFLAIGLLMAPAGVAAALLVLAAGG
jgi:Na+/H+ antiporter NhaD/arsenite permease-like protein